MPSLPVPRIRVDPADIDFIFEDGPCPPDLTCRINTQLAAWRRRQLPAGAGISNAPRKAVWRLDDVAGYFDVDPKTVVNIFVYELGLRGMHLGRVWRFRRDDVLAFELEQFITHGRRRT